jgi:hypothetical protein
VLLRGKPNYSLLIAVSWQTNYSASPAIVALPSWHSDKSCPPRATKAAFWKVGVFCLFEFSLSQSVFLVRQGFSIVSFGFVAVFSFWLSAFGFVWRLSSWWLSLPKPCRDTKSFSASV